MHMVLGGQAFPEPPRVLCKGIIWSLLTGEHLRARGDARLCQLGKKERCEPAEVRYRSQVKSIRHECQLRYLRVYHVVEQIYRA